MMILLRGYVNILILLILLIHLIRLILLILLINKNSINSINSIRISTVSNDFLDTLDLRGVLVYRLTAYPNAGHLSFLFTKITRFWAVFEPKNGVLRWSKMLIIDNSGYAKNTYRNHNPENSKIFANYRSYSMVNDLKRRDFQSDTFSLVQGLSLIMPILACLKVHRLGYIDLTEPIVARLLIREGINDG